MTTQQIKSKGPDKANATLERILARFEDGTIPQAVAIATFPTANVPSNRWSLLNRVLMAMEGTADARGIRQWNQVGRKVKKGCHALFILAPRLIPDKTAQPDEHGKYPPHLVGFLGVPVFKVEDTEGQPLDYQELTLPTYSLESVAQAWGLTLAAVPGNPRFLGRYSPSRSVVCLATPHEQVFFHELAHAAHEKIKGKLTPGQDWRQEVVAELSAAVLCQLAGQTGDETLGNCYRRIAHHAATAKRDPLKAIGSVIGDVEKVINLILTTAQEARQAA